MSASKDLIKVRAEGKLVPYPVKTATKIYAGTFVAIDATGYAVPLGAVAAHRFVGVADAQADNLLGQSGDINVLVWREGTFEMPATSIAITSLGAPMYGVADDEFDETDIGNCQIVGTLVGYISATKGVIDIETAVKTPASTTSADAMTVSDAGDFFPAATDTVAEQIQALAGDLVPILVPRQASWVSDGTDKEMVGPKLELNYPCRIKRAYGYVGTQPGAGETLLVKYGADTLLTFAGAVSVAESEALDVAIPANQDIFQAAGLLVNETAGGAADDLDMYLLVARDDGV